MSQVKITSQRVALLRVDQVEPEQAEQDCPLPGPLALAHRELPWACGQPSSPEEDDEVIAFSSGDCHYV